MKVCLEKFGAGLGTNFYRSLLIAIAGTVVLLVVANLFSINDQIVDKGQCGFAGF